MRAVDLLFDRDLVREESFNRLVSDGIDVRVSVDSSNAIIPLLRSSLKQFMHVTYEGILVLLLGVVDDAPMQR